MKNKYFINKLKNSRVNCEKTVESYLVQLEKLDDAHSSFYEDYMFFFSQEREKKIDDIIASLHAGKTLNNTPEEYYRIVDAPYSHRPFCTKGSSLQGGRFNFGENITSSLESFQSLYLSNNHDTAFFEKYLHKKNSKIGEGRLSPEDMLFKKSEGHIFVKAKIELDSLLDLRKDSSLDEFLKVIKSIQVPENLKNRATELKLGALSTVQNIENLRKSLFEENFKQWPVFINQPSNSQWFGHYVRQAKIQGIIYPSCREKEGYNVAIYLDTFEKSSAKINMISEFPYITEQEKTIDQNNYEIFLK